MSNDLREHLARALHCKLRWSNMTGQDWDSGAILGADNLWRKKMYETADVAIATIDDARDAEIKRLRGLLWYAWSEMNAIRAESGVPRSYDGTAKGISESYWSDVVDAMAEALGNEAQPWPSENARTALNGGDDEG